MVQQKLVFSEKINKDWEFNQKGEIPEIRFPEFDEPWVEKNLGDILSRRKKQHKISKETPLLAFASGQGVIPRSERKTNNRDFLTKDSENKNYLLTEYDDIVYNPSNLKYGAIDRNSYGKGVISPIYVTFVSNVSTLFMEQVVKSYNFQQKALKYEEGTVTKRQSVHPEDLVRIKIKIPITEDERIKIGAFLSLIDKKIELLEKSLNSYQKYYEYVSNNYFDNLTCDNIVRFKDIISKGKAGGTPKSSIKSYYGGEIPFLSINDMTTQGKYINYTTKMITEDGLNNSSAWIIPKNSLLYSIYASIGFVSINTIELSTSQAIYGVILKENINQDFIYHYLKNFKRHIYKYIETGTQGNLNSKIVKDIPIKLPSNAEQKTYADFFNKFDEIIEIKLNEIDKLKEFKKGLLQKMFV